MKHKRVFCLTLISVLALPALAFAQGGWTVVAWYGDPGTLGEGWQLCDGSNGTPDLQDQFLVGAGDTYELDDTGGAATVDLEHSHTVASHAHSLPSHNHTVAAHTHSIPSHRHTMAAHTHSISNEFHDHNHTVPAHSHVIANDTHNHVFADRDAYEADGRSGHEIGTLSPGGTLVTSWNWGPGEDIIIRYYNYTENDTHNHGGTTANSQQLTSGSDVWWHDHGGATGANSASNTGYWSGTTGSDGDGNTSNWSGTSGNASPGTSLALSSVAENRPPYTALYYICCQGVISATSPITTSMLITDPNTTNYYTTTSGVTYSRVRSISTGEEITNYLLIGLLCLVALQMLVQFIVEPKRKWN